MPANAAPGATSRHETSAAVRTRNATMKITTRTMATQAAVCYTLKALLDPEVPNNQGMLDLPEIVAPAREAAVSRAPPASLKLDKRPPVAARVLEAGPRWAPAR